MPDMKSCHIMRLLVPTGLLWTCKKDNT